MFIKLDEKTCVNLKKIRYVYVDETEKTQVMVFVGDGLPYPKCERYQRLYYGYKLEVNSEDDSVDVCRDILNSKDFALLRVSQSKVLLLNIKYFQNNLTFIEDVGDKTRLCFANNDDHMDINLPYNDVLLHLSTSLMGYEPCISFEKR